MKMKAIMRLFLLTLMLVPGAFAEDQQREETFQLYPGESYTYEGVAVSWIVPATIEQGQSIKGYLRFVGPSVSLEKVQLPSYSPFNASAGLIFFKAKREAAYLDGIAFNLQSKPDEVPSLAPEEVTHFLDFQAHKQDPTVTLDAAPHDLKIFVSNVTPVTVNEWKLQVTGEPVASVDKTTHRELIGTNLASGEEVKLPAVASARRRFGRFILEIHGVSDSYSTITADLKAEPDLTIQGADTFIPDRISIEKDETFWDFLTRMSQQYKFEVEWVEFPEHPESVDFTKSHRLAERYNHSGGFLRDLMNDCMSSGRWRRPDNQSTGDGINLFSISWPDSKHLRVEYKDYDKVLAEKEERERRNAEAERAKEEWNRDYQLEARVYHLDTLTPVTAKVLIDQLLHTHAYEFGSIYSLAVDDETLNQYLDKRIEQCVADDKANAVIVTAIPATQKKIADLLGITEEMAARKEVKQALKQYRLEVRLLKGEQGAGKEAGSSPSAAEAGVNAATKGSGLDTIVEDFSIQEAPLAEVVETLSSLGNTDINVEPNLNSRVSLNVKTKKTIRQILGDLADVYSLYIDYQPGQTIIRHPSGSDEDAGKATPLTQYGISPEDLKIIGFESAVEMGRGFAILVNQPGEEGKAMVFLSSPYSCTLEFKDIRDPYLVVRGRLEEGSGEKSNTLLENTLFLEPGKPSLLGLTNLREALILLVRWHGE
jgi:hypothetical protein